MSENQVIINDNYYEMLLNVIPYLGTYKRMSGGEGVAYFIDENFVVKEYLESDNWGVFDRVFELYCKEMKTYAEMGFNVPKIYAWMKLPNMKHYSHGEANKNRYYILEERVKGRNLYYGFLEEFYPECLSKFDKPIFLDIVQNPNDYPYEYDEIVKMYLKDYIEMNEFLESMPEDELASLIVSAYQMHMTGKHLEPDLYPCNVFVDRNDFTIIDPHIYTSADERTKTEEAMKNQFVRNLMNLFLYNDNVRDLENAVTYNVNAENKRDYSYYKRKNKKIAKAVIEKVVKIMNKYCDSPVVTDPRTYMFAFTTIKSFLGMKDASEAMAEIKTTFEK